MEPDSYYIKIQMNQELTYEKQNLKFLMENAEGKRFLKSDQTMSIERKTL